MGRKANNLTGQRFGRLIVIKRVESKFGHANWQCKCDCGGICTVTSSKLQGGSTRSCGCLRKESLIKLGKILGANSKGHKPTNINNLIGKRFGRLTVLSVVTEKRSSAGGLIYKCKCDCGNLSEVIAQDLVTGNTKSCGCLHSEISRRIWKIAIKQNRFGLYKGTQISEIKSSKLQRNNTSGVKGVCWLESEKKWRAYITVQKQRLNLGRFDNLEDAARARKEAEEKYFQPLIEEYEKGDNQ